MHTSGQQHTLLSPQTQNLKLAQRRSGSGTCLLLKELLLCWAGPCHPDELERDLITVVHDGLVHHAVAALSNADALALCCARYTYIMPAPCCTMLAATIELTPSSAACEVDSGARKRCSFGRKTPCANAFAASAHHMAAIKQPFLHLLMVPAGAVAKARALCRLPPSPSVRYLPLPLLLSRLCCAPVHQTQE